MKSLLRRFALEGLHSIGVFDVVAKIQRKGTELGREKLVAEQGRAQSLLEVQGPPSRPGELTKDALYLADYGRGWGQRLTYSVGVSYVAGMAVGGAWGFVGGVQKGGDTPKLFLNSILNGCVTGGPPIGNQAAIMTMYYVTLKSGLSLLAKEQKFATPLAGALAGALYKSPRGGARAVRHGVLGAVAFAASEKIGGRE